MKEVPYGGVCTSAQSSLRQYIYVHIWFTLGPINRNSCLYWSRLAASVVHVLSWKSLNLSCSHSNQLVYDKQDHISVVHLSSLLNFNCTSSHVHTITTSHILFEPFHTCTFIFIYGIYVFMLFIIVSCIICINCQMKNVSSSVVFLNEVISLAVTGKQ